MTRPLPLGALVALLVVLAGLPAAASDPATEPGCVTIDVADEPVCNPHLAQSPWSASHRASFAQASSPLPGPSVAQHSTIDVDKAGMLAAPIGVTFSAPYPDGRQVVWGSTVGVTNEVFKMDADTMRIIDKWIPQIESGDPQPGTVSISGAYNVLDRDNHLIVGQATALQMFGDAVEGDAESAIALLAEVDMTSVMCRPDDGDELVGITMTFDGQVAFATEQGVVGVVPRHVEDFDIDRVRTVSLNGDACDDPSVATEDLEMVSNSIAADEDGGIYVVTDQKMHRIDASPTTLSVAWSAGYPTGEGGGIRLGDGSGSTPSLMGTDAADDDFVVITDGQDLTHLTLLWRDQIPADWTALTGPDGQPLDRRIACSVPITFGREDATESASEQSVLVRGTSAVVVNNALTHEDEIEMLGLPPGAQPFTTLLSGVPSNEPQGIERVEWDPTTRTCASVAANPAVQIPNGIPTMSAATGLLYGVGSIAGVWNLQALDFETLEAAFHVDAGPLPMQNSFYAATTVGPNGEIWTGTFGGVIRFRPSGDGAALNPVEMVYGDPTVLLTGDPTDITSELLGLP